MLTCREATRLVSDGLDRSLPAATRLRLGLHLLLCRSCLRFRRAARWLHGILVSPPADVGLPPAARERIRRALDRAAHDE